MLEIDAAVYHDPYRRCEGSCTHDLARGVLVSELLDGDGPFPDSHPLLTFRPVMVRTVRPAVPMPAAS
jgi:hypothetical protein